MTNDEIKHLMREQWPTALLIDSDVERIRNIIEAAVLAEREQCAKACEDNSYDEIDDSFDSGHDFAIKKCVEAIRARGE